MRRARHICDPILRGRGSRHGSRGWDWFQNALDEREKPTAKPHRLHYEPLRPGHKRPRAYLSFRCNDEDFGKLVFELADDIVPKSVDNFIRLCSGKCDQSLSYVDSKIHHVQKEFIVQGGDVTGSDGESGHSAFGSRYFDDENFVLQHGERGVLSLANSGVNRNNSQFFVTLTPQPQLDGRAVSIGRLVDGFDVLEKMAAAFTVDLKPLEPIVVHECGLMEEA